MSGIIDINNPFSAKQGLTMALEVSRYELSSEQIDRITNFISNLGQSTYQMSITTSDQLLLDLDKCVKIFKNSQSILWIRDDFVNEVLRFEDCENTYN